MKKIIIFLLCFISLTTLHAQDKVLVFAGSSRTESLNKLLAQEAARAAEEGGAAVQYINVKDYPIPLYDGDLEQTHGMPENARFIRNQMIDSDIIIISSPNYNGGPSALLKNIIDWASRSEKDGPSRSAFKGKKFVLLCASPGVSGGKGLPPLRSIIEKIGGLVAPEDFALAYAHQAFDEAGRLKDPEAYVKLRALVKSQLSPLN